jgi:hypothetical protein
VRKTAGRLLVSTSSVSKDWPLLRTQTETVKLRLISASTWEPRDEDMKQYLRLHQEQTQLYGSAGEQKLHWTRTPHGGLTLRDVPPTLLPLIHRHPQAEHTGVLDVSDKYQTENFSNRG